MLHLFRKDDGAFCLKKLSEWNLQEQVIEFEDVDGDRKFDKSTDNVVLRCRLNEADFMSGIDPFQPAFKQTKITFPGKRRFHCIA